MLLSFHDNDHYNSVRDNKAGKPPPRITTFVKTEDGGDATTENTEVEPEDAMSTTEDQTSNPPAATKMANNVKKTAPCPCGSGLKHKKCCSANKVKQTRRSKRARRVRKRESTTEEGTDESDAEMDGNFRVLKI